MALVDHDLPLENSPCPRAVRRFLREAQRRISSFQRRTGAPAFVASDFQAVYAALRGLAAEGEGGAFCEWGSGFGVVSCLAAFLGFEAFGIEIEEELVQAAQELADDFDLPVEFIRGSFIPQGGKKLASADGFSWLTFEEAASGEEAPIEDFAVIFAYPWPDEEDFVELLFDRFAAPGCVLVTYHGAGEIRGRRKDGLAVGKSD